MCPWERSDSRVTVRSIINKARPRDQNSRLFVVFGRVFLSRSMHSPSWDSNKRMKSTCGSTEHFCKLSVQSCRFSRKDLRYSKDRLRPAATEGYVQTVALLAPVAMVRCSDGYDRQIASWMIWSRKLFRQMARAPGMAAQSACRTKRTAPTTA